MTASSRTFLFSCHTDLGPRDTNQDAVLSTELPGGRWLVAVADGMGGLEAGDLASRTALRTLHQNLTSGLGLVEAVQKANAAVFREARDRQMGTTLVAALISDTGIEIANVGDSRAYHLDPLGFFQVTRDHTMGEEAARMGLESGDQVASSAWAGTLARFLGSEENVDVDRFGPLDLHEGGWILLCSDGLHGVMSGEDLETRLLKESDPKEAASGLVASALERKTLDNVSVALVYRPVKEEKSAPVGSPRTEGTPWDPETLLLRSRRTQHRRAGARRKSVVVWVAVTLVITLAIVFFWGRTP